MIGDENGLPKDLREVNEEQFVEVFNLLRERTKDWTEITPELLKENPQFLFVFRILLGLSQLKLSKLLNVDKQWVRHFESGRQGFKRSDTIPKLVEFLNSQFSNNGIDLQKSLEMLKINQFGRKKNFIQLKFSETKFKRSFELTPKDFKSQFELLRNKTKDFTKFDPEIIISIPEFLSIFRIILKMNINEFSKSVNTTSRNLRRWESRDDMMMPETALSIMKNIENLFRQKNLFGNVDFDKVVKIFHRRFSGFGPGELVLRKKLEKNNINFDVHGNFWWRGNKINVDFVIPSTENPLIVIEVTRISERKWGDVVRRIDVLDHRFQLLKLMKPDLKTVLFIRCKKKLEKLVNKILETETVNTDSFVINDLDKIIEIIS